MAAETVTASRFKAPIFFPLAVLALGTIAAFLVAINKNFENLVLLWTACSSPSYNPSSLPTPICFAVLFFRTALNSTRSKLEEAAIVGFLASLATITAVESTKFAIVSEDGSDKLARNELTRRKQAEGVRKGPVLSRKIVDNLEWSWLLYNLAAGALAWQAIIIPAFLNLQRSGERSVATTVRSKEPIESLSIAISVAFGLLVPSTLMILQASSTPIILFWLMFPIWISYIRNIAGLFMNTVMPAAQKRGKKYITGLGPRLLPHAIPIIYSTVSHILLVKHVFTGINDRSDLTRSAVLLLEIDHLAIFLTFLYWIWERSNTTVTSGRPIPTVGNRLWPIIYTLVISLLLGPGAGVCFGWVSSDRVLEGSRQLSHYENQDKKDKNGYISNTTKYLNTDFRPHTPSSTVVERRPRARSSPKATGHFFGGPLAD